MSFYVFKDFVKVCIVSLRFFSLVLRRIREWKQQKGPHPSNQGIKTKRYAPFSHSFNKNQDFKKRYTPFIHFWKDQEKNGQKSPKRFEEQDLNPVFEGM